MGAEELPRRSGVVSSIVSTGGEGLRQRAPTPYTSPRREPTAGASRHPPPSSVDLQRATSTPSARAAWQVPLPGAQWADHRLLGRALAGAGCMAAPQVEARVRPTEMVDVSAQRSPRRGRRRRPGAGRPAPVRVQWTVSVTWSGASGRTSTRPEAVRPVDRRAQRRPSRAVGPRLAAIRIIRVGACGRRSVAGSSRPLQRLAVGRPGPRSHWWCEEAFVVDRRSRSRAWSDLVVVALAGRWDPRLPSRSCRVLAEQGRLLSVCLEVAAPTWRVGEGPPSAPARDPPSLVVDSRRRPAGSLIFGCSANDAVVVDVGGRGADSRRSYNWSA